MCASFGCALCFLSCTLILNQKFNYFIKPNFVFVKSAQFHYQTTVIISLPLCSSYIHGSSSAVSKHTKGFQFLKHHAERSPKNPCFQRIKFLSPSLPSSFSTKRSSEVGELRVSSVTSMRGRITIFTPMFINSVQKEKIERVEDAFSEFLDFEFKKHIKCRQETTSLCRKITFVVFVFACLTRLRIHNPPFHVYELVVPLSLTLLSVIGVASHLAYKNISYFIGVGSEKRVRMMNLLRILSEELRQTRGVQFDPQQFDPQQTTISLADAKAISLADAKDRVSRMVSAPLPPFPKDHLKVVFVISGASLVLLFSWVIWLLSLGDDDSTMFSGGRYATAT